MTDFQPGDEYDLVDQFAAELKLARWYAWQEDDGQAGDDLPGNGEASVAEPGQETHNPDLLTQKRPAAVLFCLDALKRFGRMSHEQVRAVAFEVATVGQAGLDFASPEQKYTLKALPGMRFSGLQMMCLMYVGFKQVDPALETGMDLQGAYQEALGLYEADL